MPYNSQNMTEARKTFPDPLVRLRTFPDAERVFDFVPVNLQTALNEGLIVVDTNVLVLPYGTGQASLEEIRRTYERLTRRKQLRVPGQVAREFADIRAEKLKTLYQQISLKRDFPLRTGSYPFLEGVHEYSDLLKCEKDLISTAGKYRGLVGRLLATIEEWQWNDPVSVLYREFFRDEVVFDPEFDRDELMRDLQFRQENHIPPGYKDAGNQHSGIGDLLVWKTILDLGKVEQKHVVFVTGEEKADWWYRSDNKALYPRFELIDEFRRMSGGKSLLMVSFAQLLKQFGVPGSVVDEVMNEEAISVSDGPGLDANELYFRCHRAERAVLKSISPTSLSSNLQRIGEDLLYVEHGDTERERASYLIKYLPVPERVRISLELSANAIKRFNKKDRLSLIFVTDSEASAVVADEIIARIVARTHPFPRIILGFVGSDGDFNLHSFFDPGANS